MRILHAIPSCLPSAGGPIEALRRIAAQVASGGHVVDVVCLDDEGGAENDAPFGRVVKLGGGLGTYGLNLRLLGWLRAHVTDYDAVVVNGLWQFHGLAVWLASRGGRVPYYIFTHGMLDPWFRTAYPVKHLKKLCYWMLAERHVVNGARGVIFTSEAERKLARCSFPCYRPTEYVTVYGTADPLADPDFVAHEPSPGLIVFLGRIHEKKGCDLLLRAFAALGERRTGYRLMIAGPCDSSLKRRLAQLANDLGISDAIEWPGLLVGRAKWDLLRSAEIFCMPSHQENFGVAIAEALACGTPVLITNKVNIWEEIEADSAGLVADDTVDGVSALLRDWIGLDAAGRAGMRAAARRCFERRFHINRVATSYLDILFPSVNGAVVSTTQPETLTTTVPEVVV